MEANDNSSPKQHQRVPREHTQYVLLRTYGGDQAESTRWQCRLLNPQSISMTTEANEHGVCGGMFTAAGYFGTEVRKTVILV